MNQAEEYKKIIKLALEEDLKPDGDITSQLMVGPTEDCKAEIVARESGRLSGSLAATLCLELCGQILGPTNNHIEFKLNDGDGFHAGTSIATLSGNARVLLAVERTLLNFLQRLSGIASQTAALVSLLHGLPVRLLDTRKTTPGLRYMEKQAFKDGGGTAHRYNLSDRILIKENHLLFNKLSPELIHQAHQEGQSRIECEVRDEAELEDVLRSGVDIIMLDNFSPQQVRQAVQRVYELCAQHGIDRHIELEASGGINETNLLDYANTGVDYLSTSLIYTRVKAVDLSMLLV